MQGQVLRTPEAPADGGEGQGMEKLASELRLLRYLARTALQQHQQAQLQQLPQQQSSVQPVPGTCEAPGRSATSEPVAAPEHTLAPVMQALCHCVSSIERVLGTAYPLLSSDTPPFSSSPGAPPLAPRPAPPPPLSLSPTSHPLDTPATRVGAAGPTKGRVLVAMHSADHALQLLKRDRQTDGDGPEPHITIVRSVLTALQEVATRLPSRQGEGQGQATGPKAVGRFYDAVVLELDCPVMDGLEGISRLCHLFNSSGAAAPHTQQTVERPLLVLVLNRGGEEAGGKAESKELLEALQSAGLRAGADLVLSDFHAVAQQLCRLSSMPLRTAASLASSPAVLPAWLSGAPTSLAGAASSSSTVLEIASFVASRAPTPPLVGTLASGHAQPTARASSPRPQPSPAPGPPETSPRRLKDDKTHASGDDQRGHKRQKMGLSPPPTGGPPGPSLSPFPTSDAQPSVSVSDKAHDLQGTQGQPRQLPGQQAEQQQQEDGERPSFSSGGTSESGGELSEGGSTGSPSLVAVKSEGEGKTGEGDAADRAVRPGAGHRACIHCHTKKVACSSFRPCRRCVLLGQECVEYNPKPRGGAAQAAARAARLAESREASSRLSPSTSRSSLHPSDGPLPPGPSPYAHPRGGPSAPLDPSLFYPPDDRPAAYPCGAPPPTPHYSRAPLSPSPADHSRSAFMPVPPADAYPQRRSYPPPSLHRPAPSMCDYPHHMLDQAPPPPAPHASSTAPPGWSREPSSYQPPAPRPYDPYGIGGAYDRPFAMPSSAPPSSLSVRRLDQPLWRLPPDPATSARHDDLLQRYHHANAPPPALPPSSSRGQTQSPAPGPVLYGTRLLSPQLPLPLAHYPPPLDWAATATDPHHYAAAYLRRQQQQQQQQQQPQQQPPHV